MEEKEIRKRRRGTAIVETDQGILVVADRGSRRFLLPGGGTKRNEPRIEAAIRELREETGLIANSAEYLFNYEGQIHTSKGGHSFRDYHKVFRIQAHREARPRREIVAVDYYKAGAEINPKLSQITQAIIEKYLALKEK
ncbi:NUDIX domain-containing protein [Candidatus Poribacteria bacterium]|nr:NUDIX domain-containing protein [Candidatus Poribacteria bacterium]